MERLIMWSPYKETREAVDDWFFEGFSFDETCEMVKIDQKKELTEMLLRHHKEIRHLIEIHDYIIGNIFGYEYCDNYLNGEFQMINKIWSIKW